MTERESRSLLAGARVATNSALNTRHDLEDKFEVFPDFTNKWIVWDLDEDNVAELGTQLL